jgi:adenylate cyclase
MPEPGARIVYEFNQFRVDPQQRLLTTAADGRPIPLPAKVFDTLLYFVERHGELLDKATLLKAIWPNVIVEENSLNQNISALRRALGESPGEHRFIVTEPGRGYRFVADVGTSVIAAAGSTALAHTERITTGATSAPAERSSIAVLPFANLTGDSGKDYFGDGMAEELIHTLARIPGLKVPSRTSSFSYKGRNIDVRQIARDLEVGTVLEGSVRSAGERIRVTAQLVDGRTGYHLWSQSYDRQFEDLFRLQDELANAIVDTLRITLGGSSAGPTVREPPTRDLEAYQSYLQAQAMTAIGAPDQILTRQMQLLRQALARDPRFARAYNLLASLRAVAIVLDVRLTGTLAEAERDVQQALALDPHQGATHAALGTIHAAQGKWVSSEERFRQALALDESDPAMRQTYGLHLAGSAGFLGRYLEAIHAARRLAPVWVVNNLNMAVANFLLGDDAEARKYAEVTVELGLAPQISPMSDLLSGLELRAGRPDAACAAVVPSMPRELMADGGAEDLQVVFTGLHDPARRSAGVQALDRLRAAFATSQMQRRRGMLWYSGLRALDTAFDIANESLDDFARHGTIGTAWAFLWMPEMLPFRQDPRFQALCQRMKLFDYWNKYGPPDNCVLRDGKLVCH